ncbi:hypothetical protein [Novipirellula rosea]|uniref:Uncharacterized protein n=1 Tax=Novipirellula rosea TaxID=1031540 RepID=A0ABP8MKD2_9BACT
MDLETALPKLSEQLSAAASERDRFTRLRVGMPRLYRHLRRVGDERSVLNRWGQSVNTDELANQDIVAAEILSLLGEITGVPMRPPGFHAGIQHTYGYLLSRIETPYGFKRDRWIQSTIEDGFGLPRQSLQALPRRGTLLGNLTVFLSQLSLRDQPPVEIVGSMASLNLDEIARIKGHRIEESFPLGSVYRKQHDSSKRHDSKKQNSDFERRHRNVQLRTDLFPFPRSTGDERNRGLLVYSIREGTNPARLITTFPVGQATMDEWMDPSKMGKRQPIRLRFNAYLDGFPADGIRGERRLHELDANPLS